MHQTEPTYRKKIHVLYVAHSLHRWWTLCCPPTTWLMFAWSLSQCCSLCQKLELIFSKSGVRTVLLEYRTMSTNFRHYTCDGNGIFQQDNALMWVPRLNKLRRWSLTRTAGVLHVREQLQFLCYCSSAGNAFLNQVKVWQLSIFWFSSFSLTFLPQVTKIHSRMSKL